MQYVELIKYSKPKPLYAAGLLDDSDIKRLKSEGFNVVRKGAIKSNKAKAVNKNGIRVV